MATDYFFDQEKNNLPLIVYTHGFNGFKDWGDFDLIAIEFAKAGYFFIKYNLSHSGTNLENPSDFVELERYRKNNYSKELYDLQCVLNQVTDENFEYKNNINLKKIYLLGHSRGGAITILAGQDSRVSKLVTWASISACTSPWTNFSTLEMEHWKQQKSFYYENKRTSQLLPIDYQIYEDYQANKEKFDLEKAVASMKKPMLFIHGKDDPAVPVISAELLQSANAPFAKKIICDGDHVFGRKHPWPHDYLPAQTKFVVAETISFFNKIAEQ